MKFELVIAENIRFGLFWPIAWNGADLKIDLVLKRIISLVTFGRLTVVRDHAK
jgi:hypothetical protein